MWIFFEKKNETHTHHRGRKLKAHFEKMVIVTYFDRKNVKFDFENRMAIGFASPKKILNTYLRP